MRNTNRAGAFRTLRQPASGGCGQFQLLAAGAAEGDKVAVRCGHGRVLRVRIERGNRGERFECDPAGQETVETSLLRDAGGSQYENGTSAHRAPGRIRHVWQAPGRSATLRETCCRA